MFCLWRDMWIISKKKGKIGFILLIVIIFMADFNWQIIPYSFDVRGITELKDLDALLKFNSKVYGYELCQGRVL